ncbi:MAG: XdhC family protein [Methylobacteriaceae bacterium]|nr:XdhC family protein [Methylobacteriaceae bacterium]MCC0002176.1 XdhC family protein [Methylobacteriaceae bacterium]
MKLDILKSLNEERRARRAAVLVTDLSSGAQRLVKAAEIAADPMAEAIDKQLRMGKSASVDIEGKTYFLTVQAPPARLVVIGAVHVSQALAEMARLVDFDVTIVDPRTAFASEERFPNVRVIAEWPDKVLPEIGLDPYTGIAALTHDPKIDDPALKLALQASCFYIGALGSKKTHAKRVERLTAAGFSQEQIGRIHAPIGLDIGAVSPAEIAVSVLSEIVLSLRRKPLRSEKEKAA